MLAVINYGAGNLHSVVKALEHVGASVTVTSDPATIEAADAVILPGVGAAADTMGGLERAGLVGSIRKFVGSGKPFLGVCIGMQVMMSWSEEDGGADCLDLVPGKVRRLPPGPKVPHMGWNQVQLRDRHWLFSGVPDDSYFYFVHSYYATPENREFVLGETEHGITFCSVIAKDNIVATQFHPEKSADFGLKIYENFCRRVGEI